MYLYYFSIKMAQKFMLFVLLVISIAVVQECYGNAIRDERNLPLGLDKLLELDALGQLGNANKLLGELGLGKRKKRLLGLLGGGGQGGGGGGALDLGSLLGSLTNTLGGLTQGLGLGNLLGRRRRLADDLDLDLDAADFADARDY